MTPATPADLRRLDDEAFVPADLRSQGGSAVPAIVAGTRTGRFSAAEPNLSPAPRDVPAPAPLGTLNDSVQKILAERPAPRRFAVSDVFSDQGVVVVTFDGEWPDPIKAAEAWAKVRDPKAAGFQIGARQFRVREIPADAPVRDFTYTPVRDAEGHYVADVVTEGPR